MATPSPNRALWRRSGRVFPIVSALVGGLSALACRCGRGTPEPSLTESRLPERERPAVWITSDGWVPTDPQSEPMLGKPTHRIELFALRGETVSFQVVVQAAARALERVSVDLDPFELEARERPEAAVLSLEVSRFLVYPLPMVRRSGGKFPGESLGWARGAAPPGPRPGGTLSDPLIPVEAAPAWAAYPMRIEPAQHQTVWIDVTVPEQSVAPGRYRSLLKVAEGAEASTPVSLAKIPVTIEVGRPLLPYAALNTMVYFEPDTLRATLGSETAVDQYQQLMHAHHLTTAMPINVPADVDANAAYLTGELFTAARGYRGPGVGVRPNVVVLGAYGGLGDPSPAGVRTVDALLERLERLGVRDRPRELDVFLYAVDEQCKSPRGSDWKRWLAGSSVTRVRALRVAQTCSEPPAEQAVDLVMVAAQSYAPALVEAAVRRGKHVWIYNGALPQTGAFLTDSWRLSLRANAWIQAAYGIERWFYWESTFWGDSNRGGHGAHDLFAGSETFHNQDGDYCSGDGVLVYPGKQPKFLAHSAGYEGVLPSVRLKQWRRGISDAGYLSLARGIDPTRAERLARSLTRGALDQARPRPVPLWPTTPDAYETARLELFELVRAHP